MRNLTLKLTQPQADFFQLTCKYPAFVAGFGTGKSQVMCASAICDATHSPDALVGMYSPTYDLIRLVTAARMEEMLIELGIRYKYNKSENIIYTASSQIGDFVLRTMDNPARIVGYQTYRAHCDELDTLKPDHARDAWNKIIARNRQAPAGVEKPFNRVSAYTTPEGFRFVHDRWVVNGSDAYQYIQASTRSNPYLPDDYVDSLRATYPAGLIDAYIDGKFVNLTSGTVYNAFDRNRCNSTATIEGNERLYIGQDFNVGKMASVVYVRRGEAMHAVDELVDLYDTPALIETIRNRYDGHKIVIYPDASGKSRKTNNASTSDIAMLKQAGFEVRVKSTNPMVRDRIVSVNAALSHERLFVNTKRCPEFTRCLEQQAYDKNGEPDKDGGFDHMNDAGGYPVVYEMPVRKPVSNIRVGFNL